MTVLDTGGAGYVGCHAVKELRANGIPCVVLDNLSRGHRELVVDAELIVGDVADSKLVPRILADFGITALMQFAAYAYVGESMRDPAGYYQNNVAATIH
jgi:UDP-glucose 4-epimerase